MSLYSDRDIAALLERGQLPNEPFGMHIRIEPYANAQLQPSSYDVRLDNEFKIFDNSRATAIDPKVEQPMRRVTIDHGPFVLHPGEFVLGSTIERVTLGDRVAARLEGKSSMGRLGLLTHATAGFIDPGFDGHVTLELANVANLPLLLWPKMKIGQLCFFDMSSRSRAPYGLGRGSHYQHQRGPTPSRAHLQFEEE